VPPRAAVVATVLVAPLWELARRGFTAYVELSGGYGKLYGSFGVALATLVWIYYSAAIFTVGAEIAAEVTERAAAAHVAVEGRATPAAPC
jgi:membrane protein